MSPNKEKELLEGCVESTVANDRFTYSYSVKVSDSNYGSREMFASFSSDRMKDESTEELKNRVAAEVHDFLKARVKKMKELVVQ